jgi:hypothetical protein
MALMTAKTPAPENTRRWGKYWLAGWVALSLILVARALLGSSAGNGDTGKQAARSGAKAARITKPIEQIQVGERVLADNPLLDDETDEDGSFRDEIDPSSWRRVVLKAPKTDGTFARVTLLRPMTWLKDRRAEVGGTVPISVPECSIGGNAAVLAIGPCPNIRPGKGQVVTGTFHHESARVVDVHVAGVPGPIGTTANHRFWSEDRNQFVAASLLKPGERLRGGEGTLQVTQVVPRGTVEPVYNLEVQLHHVYHVSEAGILVHNAGEPKTILPFPSELNLGMKTKGIVYIIKGKLNGQTHLYVGTTYNPERISGSTRHPARQLLQFGEDVEVRIKVFDLEESVAKMVKEEGVSERRAANRISRSHEQLVLETELEKAGIDKVNGTNEDGSVKNINKDRAQSEENVARYRDRYVDPWDGRTQEVTIRQCP